jgi:alkanesulfonate monooxygenase SsuD/methylene tetrahydromethanopterin reductase-like flavin-dependent oxidoreductase (luciferase family)
MEVSSINIKRLCDLQQGLNANTSAPGDNSRTKDRLKYYIDLAKLAEKHKITCIFFADTYAGHDIYGGNMDAVLRAGTQVAQLDPLVIISAMAVSG